jgi:heterotetrameric sarcosine oxidase gamma subunit
MTPSSPPAPRYDARVRLQPVPALIDLQGGAEDVLPRLRLLALDDPPPLRRLQAGDRSVLRPAPGHWMLLSSSDTPAALLRSLCAAPLAEDSLFVDVSDGWAHFDLRGPEAAELLGAACPLDTHPRAFATDGATFTEAFGLRALLLRRPTGFQLAVERSHGPMVADWFARLQGTPRASPLSVDADIC